MDIGLFFQGLILIASIGFLVAVYFAFMLAKEARNEKYWVALALSALFLAIHQWVMIPWGFHIITGNIKMIIQQLSAIIGAVLFGYAVYGLATSMRKVRKRME